MEDKEKIESKNNCCEDTKGCSNCMNGCSNMHGYHHNFGGRCHIVRKVIFVFIIIAAFCFGTQYGMMKASYRSDYRFERGGMMDWGFNQVRPVQQGATGSVTVDVTKTPAPAAQQ